MSELKEKGLGVFINLDKWGISTFNLKIIAMITMIIDHVGFLFFQDNHQTYIILRSIGRISFPIFCFVLRGEPLNVCYYTENARLCQAVF